MLNKLIYVSCDLCEAPAGTTEDMRESVRDARLRAWQLQFRRIRTKGRIRDFCPTCATRREA